MHDDLSSPSLSGPYVQILGAGIIGLSCAWALARGGARVSVFDIGPPGRGASWAAAGMIAPAFEAAAESGAHPRLLDLCLKSADRWAQWVAELEAASGQSCDYRASGSLAVACSSDEATALTELADALVARQIRHHWLKPAELRQIEPALAAQIGPALYLPTDSQVDNRRVIAALIRVVRRLGLFVETPQSDADILLDTRGWQSDGVMPIGGQMLSLAPAPDHPEHVLRCGELYIVPKSDRTIIGATMEPGRVISEIDPVRLAGLRDRASEVCPSLGMGEILEQWGGTRPATPDRAPIIGWTDTKTYVASGHYRNGILLAPLTAEIVAAHILGCTREELAARFDPSRFGETHQGSAIQRKNA